MQRQNLSDQERKTSREEAEELFEPFEPVTWTSITEMKPKERESLLLAKDGHLYFKSTLDKLTESPFSRESLVGSVHYPTYAVQTIIEYASQLKKNNEKLAEEIKK